MEMAIEIFLCYAYEDEEYQQQLEKQLSLLQRNGRIDLWHNGKIKPGEAQQQVTFAHFPRDAQRDNSQGEMREIS